MDIRHAELVAVLSSEVDVADIVETLKLETYWHRCEHAVLLLADGNRVVVKGGRDGILLYDFETWLGIDIDGMKQRVIKLIVHTHPVPTGPSDHDIRLLSRLGQLESIVYELSGPVEGTIFRQKEA